MKKKKNWLGEQYSLSWKYLKESRNLIFLVIILFFIFGIGGFLFPVFFKELILNFLTELASQIEGLGFSGLFLFILQNNIKASFFALFLGILFGIFPAINLLINGYVLGFVSNLAVKEEGYSTLLRLLPHGIFELPALFISLGIGLKLGLWFTKKHKKKYLRDNLKNSLRVFLFIVFPLLILAGLIETFLILFFS